MAEGTGESPKSFKDWLSACQPNGYCAAMTYATRGPGGPSDYVLRVGRQAQQTYWELSFAPLAKVDPAKGMVVTVGKEAASFVFPDQVAPYGSVNDFFFLGPAAQSVLDKLVHAGSAEIRFTDTGGREEGVTFSLDGIGAALIWIDGLQGRIGSERVAEAPPYGLFRADVLGASWMEPALAFFQCSPYLDCDGDKIRQPSAP
ncbi:MAG TPA: DUF1176 domain-containing protein [Devosiaceae bacterium]|nr:DUF1176 domain-containing protein [Devosiaceae bacterium]